MCSPFRCECCVLGRGRDARLLAVVRSADKGITPQHRCSGDGRNAALASRICWSKSCETMTSAPLERDRAPVPDSLRADLHRPVTKGGYQPMADLIEQGQCGGNWRGSRSGMQLQPNGISGEAAAEQAGPDDRIPSAKCSRTELFAPNTTATNPPNGHKTPPPRMAI